MITASPSIDSQKSREPARELKFLVPADLVPKIHGWANARLSPDPYADPALGNAYEITSLYFDTPGWHVLRRVGSFARSKYRVRRYDRHGSIFFERKLKTGGRVSKRRTPAAAEELKRLAERDPDRGWSGWWYHRRLLVRELQPVCQIRYRRAAWMMGTPQGALRLTLDDRLRAVAVAEAAFDDSSVGLPLMTGQFILELKFRRDLPALFESLVKEFGLRTQPLSKYRLAASLLGLVGERGAALEASDTPPHPQNGKSHAHFTSGTPPDVAGAHRSADLPVRGFAGLSGPANQAPENSPQAEGLNGSAAKNARSREAKMKLLFAHGHPMPSTSTLCSIG